MRTVKLIVVVGLLTFMAACGGAGSSNLNVKLGGKDISMPVRSSLVDKSVFTYTAGPGAPPATATTFTILLANFEGDTTNIATMKKSLTNADQSLIYLSLTGEEGTDLKGELKPGTFKVDPAGKWMKVGSLSVTTVADGKPFETRFDMMFSGSKATGDVKITSVTSDKVSGTIDISEGDKSVKGNFTAKLPAK